MVAPQEMDLMMAEANKLDVDVLCWGGTHRFDAYEYENKFFVNPGSATGAMTTGWVAEGEEVVPCFCLMDVSRSRCAVLGIPANNVGGTGPGHWLDALRLPVEEGCEWS